MAFSMVGRALRGRRAGEGKLTWHRTAAGAGETFTLTSPAFGDGCPIPLRHAATKAGQNLSPPLAWSGEPPQAAELVLIVEDADAPTPRPFVHCVARIDPAIGSLPEGALAPGTAVKGITIGRGGLRQTGYTGPRPIPGHGPHHYVFQLFALDRALPQPSTISPRALAAAMSGRVIARARLTGVFELA
jgi:Raf kinase inhibitor-like YbhB/YbcL family protein